MTVPAQASTSVPAADPAPAKAREERPTDQREIYPFGLFPDRASAIEGVGGNLGVPDGSYCFHTTYVPAGVGRARFSVAINGVTCERGELAMRVLAFKHGADAIAVAGRTVDLLGLEKADFHAELNFRAEKDVIYAFVGDLGEPTDIRANALTVTLSEFGQAEQEAVRRLAHGVSRPTSTEAPRGANKLFSLGKPSIDWPASQALDTQQFQALRNSPNWQDLTSKLDDPAEAWEAFTSLAALHRADLLSAGVSGVISGLSPALAAFLRTQGLSVDTAFSGDIHDFAIARAGSLNHASALLDLNNLFDSLADGGLGMLFLPCPAGTAPGPLRNAVQQIALAILAKGHAFSQIIIDPRYGWTPVNDVAGSFLIQFRRSISAATKEGD